MAAGSGTPGTPRVLRAMNDRAALDLLLEHGPLSRARIGRLTGLSKPTSSQLLARLEAAGLVVATGTTAGRPGPGAQLYAVNAGAAFAAGLDVTPHRIRAAVADLTGAVVGEYELPTPGRRARSAVREVTEALDGAVRAAGLTRAEVRRLVIGTPGAFDPSTGRLRYASHLPGWHSPTLLEELAAALPMPVEYENDVNLAAVAEQRLGAARGHDDFVLLWNEEGLGAALVIGGRLHRGFTGGAGEVGFMPVPGTPLVRRVARADSGGFQELAGAQALPRIARDVGVKAVPGQGGGAHAEAAAALLARAAEADAHAAARDPRAVGASAPDAPTPTPDRDGGGTTAPGLGGTDEGPGPGRIGGAGTAGTADARQTGRGTGGTDGAGLIAGAAVPAGGAGRDIGGMGHCTGRDTGGAGRDIGGTSGTGHAAGRDTGSADRDIGDTGDAGGAGGPSRPGGGADPEPYRRLLDAYATGLATGLASLVAVLDPRLVVLSGAVLAAGGEPLRSRVQAELAELAAPRPRLVLGAVHENPVLRGALESALTAVRDDVFDTSR
ncbi:ROK family transcriptional regulator [Streptomyces sp. HNM0663]|uniref:ROK family transcriptional regulator n=1 Tax=Streptomyces chengmaiensis TaxID=3040919 RepID=A0ABT6HT92_9ACTN|nr:ROK family transcriptional regulator [Streptomyces chengmaiensis]MDH2391555.1 ROK family transcriptional regulator [Streptomyces chengmaiensis]